MTTELRTEPRTNHTSHTDAKLGEELPVFCERCGYSLHGLPQSRCEHCTILQFHCPECGHHQPINTLRPAAQTMLGRLRGAWLVWVVLFKLNLIGWTLFGWVGMGAEWSYRYDWEATNAARQQAQAQIQAQLQIVPGQTPTQMQQRAIIAAQMQQPVIVPRTIDWESALAFGLFGLGFGLVLRMALLRWKRGWAVGLVLGTLVVGCIMLGVVLRGLDMGDRAEALASPYTSDFVTLIFLAFACIVLGATVVWPLWTLLVRAFLPKRTSDSLLNWQRSLSNQVSSLAREPIATQS